jgi:long-chain acyl-CoA synthetase
VARGIVRSDGMYDFAFKKIRESLGGCCKMIITGSAPISPEILHFLRVVSGCYVLEGYGATETGGACSVQIPGETTVGNIGPPFACCMNKLIDVPEMNLVVNRDNKGEICIYGHNIFKGYYKDEEKTRAALDEEGWYHTGDIGMYDKNGCLKIVDRVKNIFKLQQGEYIAPEKIENIYIRSKYVAQVFIYGNSFKSSLVSIIVPEETVVYEWAKQNSVEANFKELCQHPELKKSILQDITQMGKTGGLKGFEQVKFFL